MKTNWNQRVVLLEARGRASVQVLFEAAQRVFRIPSWDTIQKALQGNEAPLREYLLRAESALKDLPFSRPYVTRNLSGSTYYIKTNGARTLMVQEDFLQINFQRSYTYLGFESAGSLYAAGEVLGQINSPGQHDIKAYLKVGGAVPYTEYTGPVHPRLGKAAYDEVFRKALQREEEKK